MKLGVTVPCLNNFVQCVAMLHSVRSRYDVEIKIMDQWRDKKPLARAWNQGAEHLFQRGCRYVAILNDDILLGPDCLDNMVHELAHPRDPAIILVSSNNIFAQMAPNIEAILDHHDTFEGSTVSDHPNYSTFMIGKDFFDKHGTFDENFVPAWKEDQDSHRRLQLLGYRGVCTTAASSIHYGSVTTQLLRQQGHVDSSTSHAYFLAKWGADWPNEIYTHPYNNPEMSPREWRRQ